MWQSAHLGYLFLNIKSAISQTNIIIATLILSYQINNKTIRLKYIIKKKRKILKMKKQQNTKQKTVVQVTGL